MMLMRSTIFGALLALSSAALPARAWAEVATYANPLDVIIADPFVLRHGDTYYLYGTTDAASTSRSKNPLPRARSICPPRSKSQNMLKMRWIAPK